MLFVSFTVSQKGRGVLRGMRRRPNEGTVHPTVYKGQVVSWRGLATYVDPTTGKRRRKSVSRKTHREAEQALRALIRELPSTQVNHRPKTAQPAHLPPAYDEEGLHALIVRWAAYKRAEVRPSTYRGYVQVLTLLLPLVGERSPGSLTVLDVEDAVRHLRDRHSPKTAARGLRVLGMVLRQAVRWQLIPSNVAQGVRPPRVSKPELHLWSPEQVLRFLEGAQAHRLYPLFLLALGTGMRKGELLALCWQDVDLEVGELTVQRNLVKNEAGQYELGLPKTENGKRGIPLAQDAVDALTAHREAERRGQRRPRPGDFVFTAASGNHVQHRHLDKVYRRLMEAAGLPRIRFHDLRHTAASLLIRQGVPAKVVADRLGHADVRFTLQVYTHVYDDQRTAAALTMQQLTGRPGTREARPGHDLQSIDRGALRALYDALYLVLKRAGPTPVG